MSGFVVSSQFLDQLSDDDRRRILAFATEPARSAFLSRFGSDTEKRAHFSEMGKRSGAVRRARANGKERAAEVSAA